MNLYNIKHPEEQVNFTQGVRQGLGKDQGLFFPEVLPKFDDIDALLALPLVERSQKILGALITERDAQQNGGKCVYLPSTTCLCE